MQEKGMSLTEVVVAIGLISIAASGYLALDHYSLRDLIKMREKRRRFETLFIWNGTEEASCTTFTEEPHSINCTKNNEELRKAVDRIFVEG